MAGSNLTDLGDFGATDTGSYVRGIDVGDGDEQRHYDVELVERPANAKGEVCLAAFDPTERLIYIDRSLTAQQRLSALLQMLYIAWEPLVAEHLPRADEPRRYAYLTQCVMENVWGRKFSRETGQLIGRQGGAL